MNDERVMSAARALDGGGYLDNRSEDESLIDLLTDLLHWSAAYGEDFDKCLDTARMHYEAEADE